ncbi:MAG: hypothetical protein AAB209_02420 [Bacteroidota bacterium]
MNPLIIDAQIVDGVLTVKDLPLKNAEVKVVITPKVKLEEMSFLLVQEILSGVKRDLAEVIIKERGET